MIVLVLFLRVVILMREIDLFLGGRDLEWVEFI